MKKQIFRSVCFASAVVFVASFVLIMETLYGYFSSEQANVLKTETALAAAAVEAGGAEYLNGISGGDCRVTWIAPDGTVLFDDRANASEMENHMERKEIKEALSTGTGQSMRYSTTLMERQLYCAKMLSDGSVLRLSNTHLALWALIPGMFRPIALVIVIALSIAVLLANSLSNRIVKPLDGIDLEAAEPEAAYEELAPFIDRIVNQREQLKMQQRILERKKEEFDAATDNMREGIVLFGKNGDILSINRAASRILGLTAYGKSGMPDFPGSVPEIKELIQAAAEGVHSEKTAAVGSKEYRFNASPVVTENTVTGVALIIFDITEKEKAEAMRREFTANVSHELKTPLQNISGCAELLAGGMVKAEDVPVFSMRIYSEAKRMIALIEDIIKLSHLDENTDSYEFENTDLYALAKAAHRSLLPAALKRDITFTLAGGSARVSGIPALLSEIIYNLCDNAIKYNRKGGKVTVTTEDKGDAAVLSVEDTGIGIPAEEQGRIFERFYRVDKSRSKEAGGTGLGLSIAKHAAGLHGAEIEVTSKTGQGTLFTVTFQKEKQA